MNTITMSSPAMRWDDDRQLFVLLEAMDVVWTRPGKRDVVLRIPPLAVTDLASIPRRLQSVVGKLGHHLLPAVYHDHLYVLGGRSGLHKKSVDRMFLDGMKAKGVWYVKRMAMYCAVRLNRNGGNW